MDKYSKGKHSQTDYLQCFASSKEIFQKQVFGKGGLYYKQGHIIFDPVQYEVTTRKGKETELTAVHSGLCADETN